MDFDINLEDNDDSDNSSGEFQFRPVSSNNRKINLIDDNLLFNKRNISDDVLSSHSQSEDNSSEIDDTESEMQFNIPEQQNHYQHQQQNYQHQHQNNNSHHDLMIEKRELLYQFQRLKNKGIHVPYEFTVDSDINHMRATYERIKRDKEIDSSIKFQRKMLMGAVTGFEFLNTRYDPFAIELNGWSEQVHEGITDYDDIFEELHDKYKSTGSDLAPEVRLMVSLSGSAFMFHLTKRMFSESKVPKVEEVLKNNPDLMRQFQEASAKQYMGGGVPQGPTNGNTSLPQQTRNPAPPQENDIFGMVSSLFNSSPQDEVDNVINNVHSQININPMNTSGNDIETLTVTDEEISSIIDSITEETGVISTNKKKRGPKIGSTKKNSESNGTRVLSL